MADASAVDAQSQYDTYVSKRGDELDMLREVAQFAPIERAIYPGSYVHVTPSLVVDHVVYVDTDGEAKRFFRDLDAVRSVVAELCGDQRPFTLQFHGVDYADVPEPPASFDLLISLYAGFVSEACGSLLRSGGLLLANNSHGDASMAELDPHFELVAAITRRNRIRTDDLATYMQPKSGRPTTIDELRRTGRGPAFTREAKAYLFRRGGLSG